MEVLSPLLQNQTDPHTEMNQFDLDRIRDYCGNPSPEAFTFISTAQHDLLLLVAEVERLRGVLHEAALQIQYLHSKFKETGSGNNVLARIENVLYRPPPHKPTTEQVLAELDRAQPGPCDPEPNQQKK